MICQNCHATVDDDLIFCTSCGARLHETVSQMPSATSGDSVATVISPPAPRKSNFKWIALTGGVIIIACGALAAVFFFSRNDGRTAGENNSQAKTPVSSSPRNSVQSRTQPANLTPASTLPTNSAAPVDTENTPVARTQRKIISERIEISPGTNYAVPFKVGKDSAKLSGDIKIVQGEPLTGYVFLKDMYEEHYVDPNYRMSVFDVTRDSTIEQTLPAQDYVLILVNQNQQSSMVQIDLYLAE